MIENKKLFVAGHIGYRPTEVDTLLGDATKVGEKFGWVSKISVNKFVKEMAAEDMLAAKGNAFLKNSFFKPINDAK